MKIIIQMMTVNYSQIMTIVKIMTVLFTNDDSAKNSIRNDTIDNMLQKNCNGISGLNS
jgi:hypothetical protein